MLNAFWAFLTVSYSRQNLKDSPMRLLRRKHGLRIVTSTVVTQAVDVTGNVRFFRLKRSIGRLDKGNRLVIAGLRP